MIKVTVKGNGRYDYDADSVYKMLKADIEYPDYRQMPTAQAAQQILRLLDKNWKSFFKSIFLDIS